MIKMTRLTSLIFGFILVIVLPGTGYADEQSADEQSFQYGLDGTALFPLTDWKDIAEPGFGLFLRAQKPMTSKVSVTARIGYIFHIAKELDVPGVAISLGYSELPVLLGVRYEFAEDILVGVETGLNIWTLTVDSSESDTESDTEYRIPLNLSLSKRINKIEIGLQLLINNLALRNDSEDLLFGVMPSVGYNFN